jgi:hypothetical protein
MDPAALGTTIIGLDGIRSEQAVSEPSVARRRQRRQRSAIARRYLAEGLRRLAALIAPTAIDTGPRAEARP